MNLESTFIYKNLMRIIFSLLIVLISHGITFSQSWGLLPNSPTAGFRHDDIYFINGDTGWVVNVDGYIFRTNDGGNSFITQLFNPAVSFRCVVFTDSNKGWAGNLGTGSWSSTTDTMPMYQTSDGGSSWQIVTNISGSLPKGICGLDAVNDSVIYAVGRVGGPCHIIKTLNGGVSWFSINTPSGAWYLIDCHFFSADTGLVIGATGSSFTNERYAIYYTTNGGNNWQPVGNTSSFNGHGWKISFPSRYTGYVSIETSGSDSVPVLKTTDGGLTWQEKLWSILPWYAQGIGFINDSTGWCGSSTNQVKETVDSANSWTVVPFVSNFNRFRLVNDTVAFASGNRIWKYSNQVVGENELSSLPGMILKQNYPNPFSSNTIIEYSIPRRGKVTLKVYDFAGRHVTTLVDSEQEKNTYKVELLLPYFYDTHFFYTLYFDNFFLLKQMVMVK
jgi:photosystem II stability/assembly factor-like uncharacterized protein